MTEVLRAPAGMNRAQRRRMAVLGDTVERVTNADAAFFRRFPNRSYRIRLLSSPEREQMALMGGKTEIPADERWACCVKQIAPGARMRRFFTIVEGSDLDQGEDVCRSIWEHECGASDFAKTLEGQIRAGIANRDGGKV